MCRVMSTHLVFSWRQSSLTSLGKLAIWPLPPGSQLVLAGTLWRCLDLQKTLLNPIQIAAQFWRILDITIYLPYQVEGTPRMRQS